MARVHGVLKDAILSRELIPGDAISEREIERIFDVSRIPVREALKRLETQGWIESQPRRGTRILGLRGRDIKEIFQLRELLEPLAVRMASKTMTPAHRAWFRRTAAAMERCIARRDLEAFVRWDLAVHTRLAKLSGNARLEAIIVGLGEDIRRVGTYSISAPGRERASLVEHRRLLRAVWTGDASAAARSMLIHLVNTRKTVLVLGTDHERQPKQGAVRAWRRPRQQQTHREGGKR